MLASMKSNTYLIFLLATAMALLAMTALCVEEEAPSAGGSDQHRFLGPSKVVLTCDKWPRVCRIDGSRWPDCCNKNCVDVDRDRTNCGMCGNKCKYSEICCRGFCVKPASDKRNCGGCGNKCKKGSSCVYGMCSYA